MPRMLTIIHAPFGNWSLRCNSASPASQLKDSRALALVSSLSSTYNVIHVHSRFREQRGRTEPPRRRRNFPRRTRKLINARTYRSCCCCCCMQPPLVTILVMYRLLAREREDIYIAHDTLLYIFSAPMFACVREGEWYRIYARWVVLIYLFIGCILADAFYKEKSRATPPTG